MKVVIFARVSTNIQDYDRQVNELTELAAKRDWEVKAAFSEKVSGAKKNAERTELLNMVSFVETHQIDKVVVTELSRLGRDTLQVLEVIELLNSKGISLFIANYGIETLTEDSKVNPMSQFLITILAEVARMERKTIKERMDSGYNNFRANGGKVGRKAGYKKSKADMLRQYAEEVKYIKKGISLRTISKLTGTSVNTISKCKALL
ncbi:MAG: recombinase family protein [Bacteroidales bacterium]|nr:recombinase family protein [Bacteroidales bacterium]